MNRLIAKLATLHHTRAFIIGALDSPSERGHFFGMLAELGIPSIVGVLLFTNVLMGPLQDAPVAGPVFDAALPDEGIKLSLPKAPTSPDGRTLCPNNWRSTPGTIPPDAIGNLPQTHVGARSFYTCYKDGFEITIYDNGFVSGYEGNNPLTQDQAREALKR